MLTNRPRVTVGTARISARAKAYVAEVLASGRLSYGPFSERFEAAMAAAHGVRFAAFCNSGTSALQCALAALRELDDWHAGDEIVVPAVTFVASANVVVANGLTPVFVDVEPRTFGLDPARFEAAIGPRTRAVMPAHLFGLPCDMDPILAIARRHGLRVVEDSCETMFATHRGRPVGSFGDVACFSTRTSHLVGTGIGGFVCTSDERLDAIARSLMNDGRAIGAGLAGAFVFERLGYSYRASELEAALGVAQMEEAPAMLATRRAHAALLGERLAPIADLVQLPWCPPEREHAYAMYPLVLQPGAAAKNAVVAGLDQRDVETRELLPLLTQPLYRARYGDLLAALPVARRLAADGFYVGCHEGLDSADVEHLAAALIACVRGAPY